MAGLDDWRDWHIDALGEFLAACDETNKDINGELPAGSKTKIQVKAACMELRWLEIISLLDSALADEKAAEGPPDV